MVASVQIRVLKNPNRYDLDPQRVDEALDFAAAAILNANRLRIQQGRNPRGQPHRASQRARDTGGVTLVDTGSLLRSVTVLRPQSTQPGNVNTRVITVDPTARNSKTGIPVLQYARAHQFGLGNLPKREFLGIAQRDVTEASRVFFNLLQRAVTQSPQT